jgi:CPA1 family monovalent cation:H+ antiporter
MNSFLIITLLFTVSSVFSYINTRWIKLPGVIGVMLLAIIAALIALVAGKALPGFSLVVHRLTGSIDFSKALLDVLLGFLLFASALHIDASRLRKDLRGVLIISTIGVILSTVLFAGMLYYVLALISMPVPFLYCLLFGALVAPTDAVAVSALLKRSKMPERLETIISGESLFNDGIGIVLFVTFLELSEAPGKGFSFTSAAALFAQEVFGGLLLGAALGCLAYRMMRSIDDFQTILLISLTLVMGLSFLAGMLHVSIPLAAVAAGLVVGSNPLSKTDDQETDAYLERIWKLLDDLLNTVLFVLIGLQMVTVSFHASYLLVGALAILILLIARAISIFLPVALVRRSLRLKYNSILILTWGGLRGGISVALALSQPASPYRELILTGSFFIVVFSVVVQGLTLNKVVNRLI